MKIHQYLDSTYLKTTEQAGISEQETLEKINRLLSEAVDYHFKSVMIRPNYVKLARELINRENSDVLIGTVIGFPEGNYSLKSKLSEAHKAIADGANELDVVINYQAFITNKIDLVKEEIMQLTQLALKHNKTIKWIIEIAALNDDQIQNICLLIRKIIVGNFDKKYIDQVFVKSSTGFYKTPENKPNGATLEGIMLMLEHASPLPVKAAGGIKSYKDAAKMINLGVLRIGTSSAKEIAARGHTQNSY